MIVFAVLIIYSMCVAFWGLFLMTVMGSVLKRAVWSGQVSLVTWPMMPRLWELQFVHSACVLLTEML